MARTSKLPKRLQPMLATLTDGPFDDNDWIFEDSMTAFAWWHGRRNALPYSRSK